MPFTPSTASDSEAVSSSVATCRPASLPSCASTTSACAWPPAQTSWAIAGSSFTVIP
jgi:hypothetical protein